MDPDSENEMKKPSQRRMNGGTGMKPTPEKKRRGVSIRVIHLAMVLCAAIIVVMLIFFTQRTSAVFTELQQETGNYIVRREAAHDLMEGSDYLTENVQRFVLEGNTKYLDNYFEEAFVTKRRESAIMTMSEGGAEEELVTRLQEAMEESQALMYREYYAMKLVIEALDIRDYPERLEAIELSENDSFLSAKEKMDLAKTMVMGSAYFESKELIHSRLKDDLEELDEMMNAARQEANTDMMRELSNQRSMVIGLLVMLAVLIGLTVWLGTLPLIDADRNAGKGKRVPVTGSREFRAMANRYNAMYDQLHPREPEAEESAETDGGENAPEGGEEA